MAMTSPRTTAAVALLLLVGCQNPDEPVPLYDGEWIDIAGVGRTADDTCVGTFDYVDVYAGVLAAEFGVDMPLGTFTWYTREEFDALLPCGPDRPYPYACTADDTVHSAFIPHEHELVHATNIRTGLCPDALAEGLAVYYSAEENDGRELDFGVLAERLAAPSQPSPQEDYEMLGRLAAFLVDEYGLPAVLEVCTMAGRNASGAQLSDAMQAVLGVQPDELIAALGEAPSDCSDFRVYRSKVFACGVGAAAQSLGIVDENAEAILDFGCDQAGTFPTILGDKNRRTLRFEIPNAGEYAFAVTDAATGVVPTGIEFEVSGCTPCADRLHNSGDENDPWQFPLITTLEPGRYAIEIELPADYNGTLRLAIF